VILNEIATQDTFLLLKDKAIYHLFNAEYGYFIARAFSLGLMRERNPKFYANCMLLYILFSTIYATVLPQIVYFLKTIKISDNHRHTKYITSHLVYIIFVNKYKKYVSLNIKIVFIIQEIIYFE